MFGNYNIELTTENEKYDYQKYEQKLQIEMSVNQGVKYTVLEIEDNQIQGQVKIKEEKDKITFTVKNLKSYLLLEEKKGIESFVSETATDDSVVIDGPNTKLEIDDYDSDKNYYLGLNYTEKYSEKKNSNKYNDSNLIDITIN